MKPISRGDLENNIRSATVTFGDTGETSDLNFRVDSSCLFFEQFKVGNEVIQLRLDWSDLDSNGHPILDADFIDSKTRKHRSVKGKRKSAHHTTSLPGKGRCYEWEYDDFSRQFSVAVSWRASVSESLRIGESCSAVLIPAADKKTKNC